MTQNSIQLQLPQIYVCDMQILGRSISKIVSCSFSAAFYKNKLARIDNIQEWLSQCFKQDIHYCDNLLQPCKHMQILY